MESSWISSHTVNEGEHPQRGLGPAASESQLVCALNELSLFLLFARRKRTGASQMCLKSPQTVMINIVSTSVKSFCSGFKQLEEPENQTWMEQKDLTASLPPYSVPERSCLVCITLMNRTAGLLRSVVQVSFIPLPPLSLVMAALTTPNRTIGSRGRLNTSKKKTNIIRTWNLIRCKYCL